jgi:uncharacterized protein YggE
MIARNVITALVLVFAMLGEPAWGQMGGSANSGTVSGTGTSELQRMPEIMRMRIIVTAKGKDVTEALAGLKDRVAAAKTQLTALGADKASVAIDEPQITAENNDRRRQMEMMMAQRMRGGRRPSAKKEEVKPPVSVSTTLSAQWPLKAAAGEQLLIVTTALQDKIKAADLAGAKEQSKLSPEEQEIADELAAEQMSMYDGDDTPKPGEPLFMFTASISADDRDKLLAEGYKKAREQAARLAKAAGAELGLLRSLGNNEVDASDEALMNNPYGGGNASYRMMQMMRAGRAGFGSEELTEAVGAQVGKVTYRVMVNASFELKAK